MDMTIGKRIALLRKEKGLTQEELATHMGCQPPGRQQMGE